MKYHRATADDEMSRSFGFQSVDEDAKQQRVDHVFHRVAKRYDIMNDLMSAGMHRLWKDAMVAWLAPPRHRDWRVLDVAGGTGDIAFRIIEQSDRHAYVDVLDINASMLAVGRERSVRCSLDDLTNFVEANAEALPFADASFDAYTIAFGIRNVPRISAALAEAHRVLKTGGRFLCLEFSDVEMPFLHQVYESWSFAAIPRIGSLVTGSAEPYQYLVKSIRRFPNQSDFAAMITAAGFDRVDWRNLSGGIAALHSGWKL